MIEYHDRRGESLSTRAVALIGFTGVILALVGRAELPSGAVGTLWVKGFALATVGLLLLCAYFCLRTLLPGEASAPAAHELRQAWRDWTDQQNRGKVLGDIADAYLMGKDPDKNAPVDDAKAEADRRADYFMNAAIAMLAALASLSLLLFSIYHQVM